MANSVIFTGNLNIVPGAEPLSIPVKQYDGDYTRHLQFTMYDGDVIWKIPNTVKRVSIEGTKPDSNVFSYECTYNDSTVIAPLMLQMTTNYGRIPTEVVFFDANDNRLASAPIWLMVAKSAVQSKDLASSSDFQTLKSYIDEASNYANNSDYYSKLSKSYAVGLTGIRDGEDADNSKYYSEMARLYKGAPMTADTVSDMTDQERVYVYTGSESGYTNGNWYFWDGSAWVSGGIYNAMAVETDKELLIPDVPADAEVAGTLIRTNKNIIDSYDAINVKLYGAKGDGTTDDTAAIQGCIDECFANGKYRIYFPSGTYKITAPLVLWYSYVPFWDGRGIELLGEHEGNTIIVKTGTTKYNDIDTVIYCSHDSSATDRTHGTGNYVKNFTLKNESSNSENWCINGEYYCRGRFENLNLYGMYGIKCIGYCNYYNDIISFTTATTFEDGGTSNLVGKMGSFGVRDPYKFNGQYSNYQLIFGDNCTGTFITCRPFGSCRISQIGAESCGLDCLVRVLTSPSNTAINKLVSIGNIQTNNLSTADASYIICENAKLTIGSMTILYQQTVAAVNIIKFTETYGCVDIGEVHHLSNAASHDPTKVTFVTGQGSRNVLHTHSHEGDYYLMHNGCTVLGNTIEYAGFQENPGRWDHCSIVMGGYITRNGDNLVYTSPKNTTFQYAVHPTSGSIVTNDLRTSNLGCAGFVSMGDPGTTSGVTNANKAPIPIMFIGTQDSVPANAKKDGCLLYNTSTSKLNVYYNSAWKEV